MKKIITFGMLGLAIIGLFAAKSDVVAGGGGTPATHFVSFGQDLPQYPGQLDRIEIKPTLDSRLHYNLMFYGPILGEPYAVFWDREASVSVKANSVNVFHYNLGFEGNSVGTSWAPADDDGFELSFFVPDTPNIITADRQLSLFEGRSIVDLDWEVFNTGSQWQTVGNPGFVGYSYNALDITYEITYYPAN